MPMSAAVVHTAGFARKVAEVVVGGFEEDVDEQIVTAGGAAAFVVLVVAEVVGTVVDVIVGEVGGAIGGAIGVGGMFEIDGSGTFVWVVALVVYENRWVLHAQGIERSQNEVGFDSDAPTAA